ncbi:hypothetical protein DM860_011204 [Cuscuta australis]|uniref:Uncharacterized protein n=1 Tax=Cuscuta australis TaxID=267555 RepID=A0A328DPT9_9ASTE|nr:hypothetical protein DM860_011204 [Cuscuta australis]
MDLKVLQFHSISLKGSINGSQGQSSGSYKHNTAMTIIKKKTGDCNFSEETREAEKFAHKILMGPQPEKGKVTGLGRGVNAKDLRKIRCDAEPTAMAKILKKLQMMEDENQKMKDQIASLTSKFGDHSSDHTNPMNDGESHEDSRQDLPFKGCPTTEVLRHDASITRSEYREGTRQNTPHHVDISHDSPCTRGGSYEGLNHDIHSNHGSKYESTMHL